MVSKNMGHLLTFLEKVPIKYREGPWSPVAYMMIALIGLGLFYTGFYAQGIDWETGFRICVFGEDANTCSARGHTLLAETMLEFGVTLQAFRIWVGSYMIFIAAFFWYNAGPWPFVSFTLTSWNILTLRLLTAYIADDASTHGLIKDYEAAILDSSQPSIHPLHYILLQSSQTLAKYTKFASLVNACITVSVWWGYVG
jgi:hypothetical protein|tara:strand:+ start:180 stop:773 length:594 start_codon:yes stop_codon:yes gene_type:complete